MTWRRETVIVLVDAARLLGVSAETIRRWRRWGLLPEPDEYRDDGVPLWRRETIVFWALDRDVSMQPNKEGASQ